MAAVFAAVDRQIETRFSRSIESVRVLVCGGAKRRRSRIKDVTHFYGHSFSLDNNPPNISPFRQQWVAQRKSEVNGKNCYLKIEHMSKAKVERFQPWRYFFVLYRI